MLDKLCLCKLAGFTQPVNIVGSSNYFTEVIMADFDKISDSLAETLQTRVGVLIVVNHLLYSATEDIIRQRCSIGHRVLYFSGEVLNFTHLADSDHTYVVVSLPHGQTIQTILDYMLSRYNFQFIYTANAAAWLTAKPTVTDQLLVTEATRPDIGTRIPLDIMWLVVTGS